jgi:hypothetical protein
VLSQVPESLAFKVILSQDSLSNTFTFPQGASSSSITVYRKEVDSFNWSLKANLPASTTTWTDSDAVAGALWEYKFDAMMASIHSLQFIAVANRLPPRHNQGVMMLVLGTTSEQESQQLNPYYDRLISDLTCDGWIVLVRFMHLGENHVSLRGWIRDQMALHPSNFHSLYLIGEVPVPYSGLIYPDGHLDHKGAWPSDTYYAFSENVFSDSIVSDASSGFAANHNLIGDAKWDQSYFPDTAQVFDLGVGRIAFHDLPVFGTSPIELTIRYLNRTHAYRRADFRLDPRAYISDGFGYFGGESFASAPIRNGQALFGVNQVNSLGNYPITSNENCQFYYACAGGNFSSCGGIVNAGMLVNQPSYAGFCSMFGSYFGDWNTSNNLLRATLAADGYTLTNCWNGRPLWTFHHMGAGYPIGYSAKWAMNNSFTYPSNYGARFAHIGLRGDPSLRLHVVKPPSNLTVVQTFQGMEIGWDASPEATHGHYVYRQNPFTQEYEVLNNGNPVFSNSYLDNQFQNPNLSYMVRACKLEEQASGSYYNLSLGIMGASQGTVNSTIHGSWEPIMEITPNPSRSSFLLKVEGMGSDLYSVEVVGLNGNMIRVESYSSEQLSRGISFSGLSAGVYAARVLKQNNSVVCSKKVVVLP